MKYMSKLIDMTGQKINRLTVLERAPKKPSRQRAYWICQCDCGKIIEVNGSDLRNGHTNSCGCYQKDRTSESCKINLIGKTIGNFTVLEYIQKEKTNNASRSKWRCRCNLCGNENVLLDGSNLKVQYSCGCSISSKGERRIEEILLENNISFIKEKRFSDLRFKDTNYLARFDFFVNNNYIIEYNGVQHYIQKNGVFDNEEKFQKTQEHDRIKNEYCKKHNIPLIRIPYTHLDNITLEDLSPESSKFLLS